MFKNWHYVINCHKKTGHYGRYPERVALWLARVLSAATGKTIDTQDAEMRRADIAFNKLNYNRFGGY